MITSEAFQVVILSQVCRVVFCLSAKFSWAFQTLVISTLLQEAVIAAVKICSSGL